MTTEPLSRNFNFRQLLFASVASQFGNHAAILVLPMTAVLLLAASPLDVGLLNTATTAAFLLIGLPAGVWVDRLRRRPILIVADVVRAVLLASVPLAWALGALTLPHLYAVAFGMSVASVFFDVGYQSYLPALVTPSHLMGSNSLLNVVEYTARVAGPGAGGWLIQLLGPPVAVLASAISFLSSGLFTRRIDAVEPIADSGRERHLLREIREGLTFVLRHRVLRLIVLSTAIANLANGAVTAIQTIFLVRDIGLNAGFIGLVFTCSAVGGLLAGLAMGPLAARFGQARVAWWALLVSEPFWLLLPLTQPGWRVAFFVVGTAVGSAAAVIYNVARVAYRQTVTPPHLLGRMNASVRTIVWGALPVGSLLGGVLGELVGVRTTLWIAVSIHLTCVVPLAFSPLSRMRDFPTS